MEQKVELHHIVFSIAAIVVTFIIERYISDLRVMESGPIFFILHYFILLVIVRILLVFVFYHLFKLLPQSENYKTERHLGVGDLNLASSVIITIFLLMDINDLFMVIVSTPVVFFTTYFLSNKIPFP